MIRMFRVDSRLVFGKLPVAGLGVDSREEPAVAAEQNRLPLRQAAEGTKTW